MSRRDSDDLTRYGIYKNKLRQQIYYDKRSKQAYLVSDADIKKIQAFSNRYFLAFSMGVLAFGILKLNIYISGLLVVVLAIALEYYFRKVLIARLSPTKNMEGVEIKSMKEAHMEMPKNVLLLRVFGYYICGVALIVITYFSDFEFWQKMAIWAFGVYAIINGVISTLAYIAKRKEQL